MNPKERRILYEASRALMRIPPPKADRVSGAIEYSREVRTAIGKFNSLVDFMISGDDPEMTEFLLGQLVEFAERIEAK